MDTKYSTLTLVVNIKREPFADILPQPRRQQVEHREMKEYWKRRLAKVGKPPFNLRLLNRMPPPVPEATFRVTKVIRRKRDKIIELHLGKVLIVKTGIGRKNVQQNSANDIHYRRCSRQAGSALKGEL